ncbi:putative sterigmatocystin biosynthesis monooxygenase stcW [Hypsizygus marmoreus]|uniref:Sterigmatocystin biosynthesis monooxygenase stcW n=1 Tax=Hypsizygus marmoreus TaxID=39966 RepID=A0A369JPB8_HYPMA|nr:putative sterigmatocystin biosynthesis monooxygenase stcW [Hypsizygus marmoreus]
MANDSVPRNTNGHGATPANGSADSWRLEDHIYKERHMRIACIGAGASGLLLAYKLQRSFQNFELVLYEKNESIAGTWFENKYPGCACDVPAHTYTWSFEPKVDWSSVYAGSDEILQYFEDFAKKYDLYKYVKLRHYVSGATWNEAAGGWDLEVEDLGQGVSARDRCDILINAAGVLNAWKWPNIPGLDDFKGPLLHTANYDRSTDLTGKHVGLIGNGSSAIQVLPAIYPKVSRVTTFIRRPTWVAPTQGSEQHVYTEAERETFRTKPEEHLKYRKEQEERMNALFPMFIAGSDVQNMTYDFMLAQMKEKLHDEVLSTRLIPTFGVGCRRITPGVNYLETLVADNVEVVYGEIERITETGVFSANGQEYPVDILICATGFDTSFKPRFTLIGKDGKNLAEEWADEAKSYFGMGVAGFPNYFTSIGPNSPIGNGPVLSGVEAQIDYMLKFVNRWQTENIHSFSPKAEAVEDFITYKDQFMKHTVWEHDCRSWYKNNSSSGKVNALWPGSTLHYMEAIMDVRYEDWEFSYSGNRFAYLGNGFSQTEVDPTADWAYYIRNSDDSPYLSRGKQMKVINRSGTKDKSSALAQAVTV